MRKLAEATAVANHELVALGPVRDDRLELTEFVPLVRIKTEAEPAHSAGVIGV
jgi:hypothetical protein